MSLRRRFLVAAVLGTALAACGSDSTGANASVVSTWTLTKFEFTNDANAAQKTDIIGLGGHGTITFNANLTWAIAVTLPGGGSFNGAGTYTETATTLTIVTSGQSPSTSVFTKTVTSTTLTLTGGAATFDFGAGDVPAHINVTATR
jgi:hypothetical protein